MIRAPEGLPGKRQSRGRCLSPLGSPLSPLGSLLSPGIFRAGQQRGWVQQWCKPRPGKIPAKQNSGVLGHTKISPAARDVSDHNEQDHPPPPRGSVLVIVKAEPCPAKPMGAGVPSWAGTARVLRCRSAAAPLPRAWEVLGLPFTSAAPSGSLSSGRIPGSLLGSPKSDTSAEPPSQHIRDVGRMPLSFRDHSVGVAQSHLPWGNRASSAWMRCPRAVAAPAGGTRWNRGSFICVFPAKPGGSCLIQGQCPGWIQPGSSSAQAVASPRERRKLGTTALNATELVTREIQSPAASRMLAQGFLIQVPAGLLGQAGQTDRERRSWELQKSHVWLLFHFY